MIASRKNADEKVSIDHMAWYSNYLKQTDIHVYVHHNDQDDSYEVHQLRDANTWRLPYHCAVL